MDKVKSVQLNVRVTPDELDRIDNAAANVGLDRSAWIKQNLYFAAESRALFEDRTVAISKEMLRLVSILVWHLRLGLKSEQEMERLGRAKDFAARDLSRKGFRVLSPQLDNDPEGEPDEI